MRVNPTMEPIFDTRLIRITLASSGATFIAAVFCCDLPAALLAIAGCLACGTMIEENYRRGVYRAVVPERIE